MGGGGGGGGAALDPSHECEQRFLGFLALAVHFAEGLFKNLIDKSFSVIAFSWVKDSEWGDYLQEDILCLLKDREGILRL